MRAPLLLTAGLGTAAMAALPLLMPGRFETMTMLSRDARGEAAVAAGNLAHREGDRDPAFLGDLIDLNRQYGNPAAERAAIEDYLRAHPDDLAVLRKADAFYAHMQDVSAWTGILERLVAVGRDPADIEKLARIYRLWGRFAEERRLLLDHRQAELSPAISVRLAEYLAKDGDLGQAAKVLERVVGLAGADRREARTLLFDVLVRDHQPQEAARRASAWVGNGLEPSQQAIFVLTLAAAGADGAAQTLAASLPATGSQSSSLAWALANRGRVDLARTVVERWQQTADPATAEKAIRLYVDIASSLDSLGLVYRDLHQGLEGTDEAAAARAMIIARVLYEKYSYDAIAGVRPLLTGPRLARQPIFAASLAQAERNPAAVRYFLLQADLSDVDPDDADRWGSLAATAFAPLELADELGSRWRFGRLSLVLLPVWQRAAVEAGRPDPAFVALGAETGAAPRPDLQGSLG